ncbi:amidohydrolase family protein [Nocardia inohanensis]|uniref:amidohydrolase family protein n=1 Tax=Nocardia inohanensis TaxID=209246 RepID=UPI0008347AE5|nr:amidohydrolase family protein [Nocardia inohanensis]
MKGISGDKFVLRDVRVFDGDGIGEPASIVIDGGVISEDPVGAEVIDGDGAVLMPGFIDAHVHLERVEMLDLYAAHGVTTVLDMGIMQAGVLAELRASGRSADLRSAGWPIMASHGVHAPIAGITDIEIISGPEDAEAMVAERIAGGSDYIKVIMEAPGQGGLDAATAKAVVAAAHARQVKVVAHATSQGAYAMSAAAGVDFLTHVPLPDRFSAVEVERIAAAGCAVVPTLTAMEEASEKFDVTALFENSLANVLAMHEAGVLVLAGTDANEIPGVPVHPRHGAGLHRELELLVRAGLSTLEALNAATIHPARAFGLSDRGTIAPGMRADLVLIDGDPLADISATRRIRRVWCGGVEHTPAGSSRSLGAE